MKSPPSISRPHRGQSQRPQQPHLAALRAAPSQARSRRPRLLTLERPLGAAGELGRGAAEGVNGAAHRCLAGARPSPGRLRAPAGAAPWPSPRSSRSRGRRQAGRMLRRMLARAAPPSCRCLPLAVASRPRSVRVGASSPSCFGGSGRRVGPSGLLLLPRPFGAYGSGEQSVVRPSPPGGAVCSPSAPGGRAQMADGRVVGRVEARRPASPGCESSATSCPAFVLAAR